MKNSRWGWGLCVFLAVLSLGELSLRADTLNLSVPNTNKDGVVEVYAGSSFVDTTSNVVYVGNVFTGDDAFNAIYKFQTNSSLSGQTITSAKLHVYCSAITKDSSVNASGVGVKLQHYTAENSVDLEEADMTKPRADVESQTVAATGWLEFDVTSAVTADVTAGYGYTSFCIIPTDSSTTAHNIRLAELSYTSASQAYITVTYGSSSSTQLAAWPTEFSSTQGTNGWYYLYAINFDYNASETTNQMTISSDGLTYSYDGYISSTGVMLPGEVFNTSSGLRDMTILRWVSEVDSDIQLTGSFQRTRGVLPSGTFDGVTAYIYVNGVQKWSASMPETDDTAHAFDFVVPGVKTGDDIDFKLFSNWHNWADETAFSVTISTALTAPTFSPSGAYISGSTPITISSGAAGVKIYYTTTPGGDPTTNGTLYTGPVMVSGGQTLKAIAAVGSNLSAIASQTYIQSDSIVAGWPTEFSSTQGIGNWYYLYAVNLDYNSDETSYLLTWNSANNCYVGSYGPNIYSGMILPGDAYSAGYKYAAIVRWVSDETTDLKVTGAFQKKVSVDDSSIDGVTVYVRYNGEDWWTESLANIDAESHPFTVRIPRVQAGDDIDFVVYSNYHNWADETYLNATVEIAQTMAPNFSVTDEYISGATPITITSTTAGATIYYTTDGTDPTSSNPRKLYTGPVTISTETTLKAIAVANGEPSGVTSQTYYSTSHGRRVILNRGLQIQSLVNPVYPTAGPDVDLWATANFTTFMFWHSGSDNNPALLAELWEKDIPWSRESYIAEFITSWEIAYVDNFVNMQYQDELSQTAEVMAAEKTWVENMNASCPNALAYTNFLPDTSASTITAYKQTVKPDMLMFDRYPGFSFTETNRNNWYAEMQKYRVAGLAGNDGTGRWPIPYGQWLQTFRSSPTGALPSESFIRVQQFASWAFGFTFVEAFMYNKSGDDTVSPVMFNSDDTTTAVFDYVAETNRQSRNLGPALVRLVSTNLRMIMGKDSHGTVNDIPSGITTGISGADDYLTGVSVTNLGSTNGGYAGDVIIGFFKPLDEAYDGTTYSNQKYFMVTNALVGSSATATQQKIRLTFNFGTSGITSLQRLSRDTGKLETISLMSDGTGGYYVDIILDGGTGDLFKYKTGAPFVGVTRISGDANEDGAVNVSDLSLLAASYGTTSGATWYMGDFTGDGAVNVSDLSLLAANYGTGSTSTMSWADAYAQAFGTTTNDADDSSDNSTADNEDTSSTVCSSLGLSLIAGLAMLGLMIVKLEE